MKSLFPTSWFKKRRFVPKIYQLSCTACDYREQVELANKELHCLPNPELDHSDDARVVENLPARCPRCQGALKKERIPVHLRY